jgi:hypothetical protein
VIYHFATTAGQQIVKNSLNNFLITIINAAMTPVSKISVIVKTKKEKCSLKNEMYLKHYTF